MEVRERGISPASSVYTLDSISTRTSSRSSDFSDQADFEKFDEKFRRKLTHLKWRQLVAASVPSGRTLVLVGIALILAFILLQPVYHRLSITPFTDPDDSSFHPLPTFEYTGTSRPRTQLLIVVISEADDPAQRALIRSHWGARKHRRHSTEIVFLVGLSDGHRTDLQTEQRRFNDLVLTSVVEDYYNLSLKTAAMFLFAQAHYPAAKCVLKVDSDNVLNVSNVEDLCDSFGDDEELITGHCEDKTPVIREWSSKWRIPRFVFPADEFPLYCFGEAYLFVGRRVPKKLLAQLDSYGFQRSANARKMPEDVIFSGLLAEKAGIERRLTDGFALQRKEAKFGCLGGRPRAFSFHLVGEAENVEKAEIRMSAANHFDCSHIS